MANLQAAFDKNIEKRKQYREPLKEAIERVFKQYIAITKNTFIAELQKQNIHVAFRTNNHDITYIDNQNKTVFNGSDLGKAYSAKAILDRFSETDKRIKPELQKQPKRKTQSITQQPKIYLKPPEQTNSLGKIPTGSCTQCTAQKEKEKIKPKGTKPGTGFITIREDYYAHRRRYTGSAYILDKHFVFLPPHEFGANCHNSYDVNQAMIDHFRLIRIGDH